MTTPPYPARATATRQWRTLRQRRHRFEPIGPSAGELLERLAPLGEMFPEVVYLVGPAPESWARWALEGLAPNVWRPAGHYLEGATPVLRYELVGDRRRLEIHHAASWFPGAQNYTAEDAAGAFELLAGEVLANFGCALLATPATTGRECFTRSIPRGRAYPALDADTQEFLRQTLGQARIEGPDVLLADHAGAELPALYEYDGRLMYAALCWGMPTGEPVRDTRDKFEEYAFGRYLVRVRVPRDWSAPFGLLGVWDEQARRWSYPRSGAFSTWADGCEVRLAIREGWRVTVLERFLFPTSSPVLDGWAKKMVRIRERLAGDAQPIEWRRAAELARRGVRHMLLTTIGAFQGRPHKVTRAVHIDEAGDDVPIARARIDGDWVMWSEDTPARWPGLSHPEWCAAVWARARARLLEAPGNAGALHLEPNTRVVAFRTDAIYTTGAQRWTDDGTAGRFRLVRHTAEPIATPRSATELLRARARLTSEVGR